MAALPDLFVRYTSPYYPEPTNRQGRPSVQGMVLIAFLMNAYFFGLVSQQFYGYWTCCFKDPLRLKLFVIVQYLIVVFQGILIFHVAWYRFNTLLFVPSTYRAPSITWDGAINSICQLFLIMQANIFLARRIHSLTNSLFQSGLVIFLSVVAFAFGMVTSVTAWKVIFTLSVRKSLTIAWHAIQALAECLITLFLVRSLLKSRSGFRKSDNIANSLVRGAIQTGALATTWAIAGLATAMLLPHSLVYRVFDATSGSVYTHAIFDTIISRVQLREKMSATTFEVRYPIQDAQDQPSRPRHGSISAPRVPCLVFQADLEASLTSDERNCIEESHAGKTVALYDPPYLQHEEQ